MNPILGVKEMERFGLFFNKKNNVIKNALMS